MSIERIPEQGEVVDATWYCPECNTKALWIHDLKCSICDNITVVYCPQCQSHFKVSVK